MTALLWMMLWQTALVALAAAALATLLRSASARHALFLAALAGAALLPILSAQLHLTLARAARSGSAAVLVQTIAPTPNAVAPAPPATGAPFPIPDLGWMLGSLWFAAMILQALALSRRCWRARQAWRRAEAECDVAGVPVLRGADGPFTLGWLRPRIVLPASLLEHEAWTAAALAHELAHIRRRDYLWAWFAELALVPLGWHPAARWLARQVALEREAACDQAALGADAAYPTRLVEMAAALHAEIAPHAGLCLARRHGFERRIARLLAAPAPRSRARLLAATVGLTLVAAAAWAAGGGVRTAAARVPRLRAQRSVAVGAAVQAAMCLSCKAPAYPPAARAAGLQGRVQMHIEIGNDGSVTTINCGLGDPTLLAAAEDAVRDWRYHPLELNAEPVAVSSTVTVTFTLDEGPALPMVQGLRGQVCDPQGARVAGADIHATSLETGIATQAITAPDGSFALDLPSGGYQLSIQQAGFRTYTRRVNLPLQDELLVVLPLGEAQQTVLVNGGSRRRE
ncbi:MAG TPA: TonB family protein [Terriglobales bacterium]|nr:TonB family protein [Terriglobales bacterium]